MNHDNFFLPCNGILISSPLVADRYGTVGFGMAWSGLAWPGRIENGRPVAFLPKESEGAFQCFAISILVEAVKVRMREPAAADERGQNINQT